MIFFRPAVLKITLLTVILNITIGAKAQTTLAAGDILFTSYNAISATGTASDTFSFVVLTPITATTVIYFTDRGYQGGAWQASGGTEGTISWTVSTAISVGAQVEIYGFTARVNGAANGTVAQVLGGNATTGLSLGNTGDELMAFQGGGGDPTNGGASFKCGICWALNCGTTTDAGWNGAGCSYGPQSSAMPPGLTGGTNAFLAGTGGASPSYNDHGKFNCVAAPATMAGLKAGIMNKANWQFSNTSLTVMNIPPACSYLTLLPLKWISVTASLNAQKKAEINWEVQETDVALYEIEKSTDGRNFTGTAVINSRGDGIKVYQFIEMQILQGTVYYRIKQIDKDGRYTYSSVMRVSNHAASGVFVYPNPAKNTVRVNVNNSLIGTTAELIEMTGKKIRNININKQSFTVNITGLNTGIYLLSFVNGQTEKLIIE